MMKICDSCGRRVEDKHVVMSRSGCVLTDKIQMSLRGKKGQKLDPEKPYHRCREWVGGSLGRIGGATPRDYLCGPLRDVNAQDDFLAWMGV